MAEKTEIGARETSLGMFVGEGMYMGKNGEGVAMLLKYIFDGGEGANFLLEGTVKGELEMLLGSQPVPVYDGIKIEINKIIFEKKKIIVNYSLPSRNHFVRRLKTSERKNYFSV